MSYEETNLLHTWSESESFTIGGCWVQYRQGGALLKEKMPGSKNYGPDVVERVGKIPGNIYEKVICKSLMNLESSYDNFFDYVVAGEVIEHIAPGKVQHFPDTFYRIRKTGGTIILTTPNPDALLVKL